MNKIHVAGAVLVAGLISSMPLFAESNPQAEEIPPWYMSIGGGVIKFEGDEAVTKMMFMIMIAGFRLTEMGFRAIPPGGLVLPEMLCFIWSRPMTGIGIRIWYWA
jgi:hypothetical protein